jgi:hypothetical protein
MFSGVMCLCVTLGREGRANLCFLVLDHSKLLVPAAPVRQNSFCSQLLREATHKALKNAQNAHFRKTGFSKMIGSRDQAQP